jgi:hypothetical protein
MVSGWYSVVRNLHHSTGVEAMGMMVMMNHR